MGRNEEQSKDFKWPPL